MLRKINKLTTTYLESFTNLIVGAMYAIKFKKDDLASHNPMSNMDKVIVS